jgi:hypothetical protein
VGEGGAEFLGGVAPGGGEGEAGDDESGAEAKPEAYGSVVEAEGEEVADGEADDPVADDLDVEAGVGVACAAEGSGGGDLEAVEELEDGGDEEQGDGGGDNGLVGGERAGDGAGEGEENRGEDGHGCGSEEDGGPACGGGFGGCFASDGLAYADGGCGGDGEGDHEGEAGAVEGDLVACERESAHGADEEGDHTEDGDFDEDLAACGCSEECEAAEAVGFKVELHAAEAVVVAAFDAPEAKDHEEGEVAAGDGGGEAGSGDAESGDVDGAEAMPVDEEPVAYDVDEVCGDESEGDRADVVEGLEVAAEGEVEEECGGAVVERAEEGDGTGEDLVVNGQAQHEDGGAEDDEDEGEGKTGGEDEAVEKPAVGLVEAACTVGLGEEGVEAEEDAGDAEGDGVVEDLTEGGGGDGEGWVGHVSDHDGVDDAHGHPAEFGKDEREGKGEHRTDLLANGHDGAGTPPPYFGV